MELNQPNRVISLRWLVAVTVFLISLLSVAAWFMWPRSGLESEARVRNYGTLEQLTRFSNFRQAYLRANGGEAALASLQSVRATGIFESGGQQLPFFSLKRRPNQSITTITFPNYELTYVVNGDLIWQRLLMPGAAPLYEVKTGDEALALAQMGDFFDPIMRVLLFDEGIIERLSPSSWMGTPAVKVEFLTKDGQMRAAAYVEIKDMRPLARIEELPDGQERKVLYSDYRIVSGMQEPFLVETFLNDVVQSRVVLEKSDVNVGAVASLFQPPEDLVPLQLQELAVPDEGNAATSEVE
ncbi:hypothetical protein SH580_09375 [Coraliomargarita algicola]|uniref:Outer membrane lipoprotein-sorting protein n=1 Tax=Coraliomargarita algicola TaxID=3092156 RepID=A0ABZ0RR81_9BACT|nr:hypothetical protein [Coraliomargarita sp. J2-16]WPJ97921.1 hypothetical protein SH580_09375 [Coraliomargarita sp. J2-16]